MHQQLLEGYPVVIDFPVAWGDMDAFQHVNNCIYFRYFENARIAYCAQAGVHEFLQQTGIGPILGSVQCKFKFPLTYPDTISVGSKVTSLEEDRFTMKHLVVSRRFQKTAAEGEGVIVMYDYRQSQKTKVPDLIRRRLHEIERW